MEVQNCRSRSGHGLSLTLVATVWLGTYPLGSKCTSITESSLHPDPKVVLACCQSAMPT